MVAVGGPDQGGHPSGQHVCWVVDEVGARRDAVVTFLQDGLRRGERLLYVADEPLADLAALGDVEGLIRDGRLLTDRLATHFARGAVEPEAQLGQLRQLTATALDEGYTGLRMATDSTSLATDDHRRAALLTYEVLADRYIARAPVAALCTYDDQVLGTGALELASVHRQRRAFRPSGDPRFGVHLDGSRLVVDGEIDLANHEHFAATLRAAAACDRGDVVLDLSGLEFIDSRGVSELRDFLGQAAEHRLAIEDPRGFVRTIATALAWDDVLDAFT
jgi:anti-anti-sigma factor